MSSVDSYLKTLAASGARRVSVSLSMPSEADRKENVTASTEALRRAVPAD
jgi:hypothetical protein